MPIPYYLKNKGPLLVDKVRGYFDRLPPWLRDMVTIRVEKQKVDAKITDLDGSALESELKQEVTDEKLRTNRYLGDGEAGSGNDMSQLPASQVSELVITGTGQVADVTETVSASETHLTEGPPLQDGTSEQVGDLWVTKKVEAPTFDRKAFQLQKEDLLPPEFRAAIPEKTETHVVNGEATLPTLATTDLVRREEQQKVGVKETTVQSRDTTGAKPTLVGQRIDTDFNGVVSGMTKDIVPEGTTIAPVHGMLHASVTPYDDKNAVREVWRNAEAFPVVVMHNYESELNAQVDQYFYIVDAAGAYTPEGWWVLDYQERKIDAKHKQRIVNNLTALPATIVTYSTQTFTFPAILSYISFQLAALATPQRSEAQWTLGIRAGFTTPTNLATFTEFFTAEPSPVTLFTWKPTDVIFKGVSFSMNISNVLVDKWTGIGVTYAADAVYGNLVDRFNTSATVPTASSYTSLIGNSAAISSVVDRFRRLWLRRTTYINLQ